MSQQNENERYPEKGLFIWPYALELLSKRKICYPGAVLLGEIDAAINGSKPKRFIRKKTQVQALLGLSKIPANRAIENLRQRKVLRLRKVIGGYEFETRRRPRPAPGDSGHGELGNDPWVGALFLPGRLIVAFRGCDGLDLPRYRRLSGAELFTAALIYSFNRKGKPCFISAAGLGERFGFGKRMGQKVLNNLVGRNILDRSEKGRLEITPPDWDLL